MAETSIIQRWIKGSLLIMVLVLFAAEALFLYTSYRELYGRRQPGNLREPRPGAAAHGGAVRRKR